MTARWIANIAVVLGCGYIGVVFASRMEARVRQLEALEAMLTQLAFNIGFLALPLSEAMRQAASGQRGVVRRLLEQVTGLLAGRPEITRYTLMHSTKPTATMPHSRKIRWMACSMALRVRRLLPAVRFIEFSFPDNREAPSPAAADEGLPIRFYLAVGTAPAF